MPVAVELNGLLPGRGPGLGGPGTPADGRDVPPGLGAVVAGRGVLARAPVCGAAAEPLAAGCCAAGAVSLAAAGASGWACGNGTGAVPGDPSASRSAAGPVAAGAAAAGLTGSTAAGGGPASAAGATGATGAAGLRPLVAPCPSSADATTGAAGAAERPSLWGARACLGCWAANASLSLRTTGASIVEDADRTNSPISWSLAITALLSTPNSFASS
jgi:hypothetical protein